jgi:acetyl esterase/lipase
LTDGIYEWDLTLVFNDTTHGYNVAIGVVPAAFHNWTMDTIIAYALTLPSCRVPLLLFFNSSCFGYAHRTHPATAPGWAYITGTGHKCDSDDPVAYAARAQQVRIRPTLFMYHPTWCDTISITIHPNE